MTPYALITTLVLVASLVVVTRARAATPNLKVQTARTIVATWSCQDKMGVPRTRARSPWKPHSIGFRRAELALWQNRWRRCTYLLHERARQWDYTAWMPAVWIRLAECESGSKPPNWRHDSGTYTGAFGFHIDSWRQYKAPGDPARASQASPWAQWQAALRIHTRFGFSGWGCYQGPEHAWVRG